MYSTIYLATFKNHTCLTEAVLTEQFMTKDQFEARYKTNKRLSLRSICLYHFLLVESIASNAVFSSSKTKSGPRR